jgi:hypothetical protein
VKCLYPPRTASKVIFSNLVEKEAHVIKPSNAVANVQVFVFGVENIGGRKYAAEHSNKEPPLSPGSNLVATKSSA